MTENIELLELFYKSKNKSLKWKKYFPVYDKLFKRFKNKKIVFVEIGVLDGGSLEIWKNFFGKDSRIIGIDNNPDCKKLENTNFEIFIGSQSDPNFWKDFFNKVGNVDIILDDGGHTNDQQIITLTNCVPRINDGGLHIVEDTHTSYQKQYGNPYKFSFINFSKKIIDDINSTFPGSNQFKFSLNKFIHSIEFFESITAFKINRELCIENIMLDNKGFSSNNSDTTLGNIILNFREKFKFFYTFKLFNKVERLFIKLLYRNKSKKLKKLFE